MAGLGELTKGRGKKKNRYSRGYSTRDWRRGAIIADFLRGAAPKQKPPAREAGSLNEAR
jgi:hypothetical protein